MSLDMRFAITNAAAQRDIVEVSNDCVVFPRIGMEMGADGDGDGDGADGDGHAMGMGMAMIKQ